MFHLLETVFVESKVQQIHKKSDWWRKGAARFTVERTEIFSILRIWGKIGQNCILAFLLFFPLSPPPPHDSKGDTTWRESWIHHWKSIIWTFLEGAQSTQITEWKLMARVLDRIFLILFLIVVILATLVLLAWRWRTFHRRAERRLWWKDVTMKETKIFSASVTHYIWVLTLMQMLGVNDKIETNVVFPSVNVKLSLCTLSDMLKKLFENSLWSVQLIRWRILNKT